MVPLAYLALGGLIGLDVFEIGYNAYRRLEAMKENERYWSDYYDNTGITPLYPIRAGNYNDYIGSALDVNQGVVSLYHKYRR